MAGVTTGITIIYMFLLQCFTKPLLYLSFVSIFVLLVGGGFYVYFQYKNYEDSDNTQEVMKGMGILL